MATFSSHALDLVRGLPAVGLQIRLFQEGKVLFDSNTDKDGRWGPFELIERPANYKLRIENAAYFRTVSPARDTSLFCTSFEIDVYVDKSDEHLHIPILLSPSGYSFYRGS